MDAAASSFGVSCCDVVRQTMSCHATTPMLLLFCLLALVLHLYVFRLITANYRTTKIEEPTPVLIYFSFYFPFRNYFIVVLS